MMDWTDRHCRYFHRLLTRRALIYTEMITTGAILRGNRARLLRLDASEHPVALQLGGCEPRALAECARIGEEFGYDEINLNVGCPSDRVQGGRFGACLMAEPELLILDEPSLGLSPLLVEEMFTLIQTLNGQGLSILLVEQNVVQSLAIAHRAFVLEHGVIALSGQASDLLNDPGLKASYLGM